MATQLWDTYTGLESQGQVLPKDSWTLHGLWPDFCNGSYTQYCDLSRQYDPDPSPNTTTGTPAGLPVPPYAGPDIGTFLGSLGRYDLLAYMRRHWVARGQPSPGFWAHEFSKHATCYSTFDVPCYGPRYVEHEDVADFFETAVAYYRGLPTWAWLAAAGITPSNATAYSLADVRAVLAAAFGAVPYIACAGERYNATEAGAGSSDDGYTRLSEVWYCKCWAVAFSLLFRSTTYETRLTDSVPDHHVYGRPQDHNAVPVAANATGGSLGNCASTPGAIYYYERASGSEA